MADLPFLVVHGALVWKAGMLATGAASIKAAAWLRDRASGRFVKNATKHYTATATGLEAGPILVRGRLRGGGASSYEHGWNAVVHTRDSGTYVDIEGERIDFAGEVVVGCGSENRTAYWKNPEGAPVGDNPDLKKRGPQRLSIVREGDEVLVAGVLRRAAAGDADYRDNAGGWKIEPFPRQGAVGLVAQNHHARALPASPAKVVGTFGLWAMIALVGMRACGGIESSPSGHGDDAIHSLAIAAAMPGTRDDALDNLDRVLIDARTPTRIDQAIALREMQHGCTAAIDLMLDESRLDQALAAARRCGDKDREASTLALLGRYDEAAQVHAENLDADTREILAITGGKWLAAAGIDSEPCANAFFTALGKHEPMFQPERSPRCELLATQVLAPERRGVFAASITTDRSDDSALAAALVDLDSAHAVHGGYDFNRAGRDVLAGTGDASALVWTSRPGDVTPARAVFETYRGDFDKAQAIAGELIAQATDSPQLVTAQYFAAAIAIRAGRPVAPEWLASAAPADFADDDLGAPFMIVRGLSNPSLARGAYGLTNAMHGDGGDLRNEWHELTLDDAVKLIAVLPKVVTSRSATVDFMRSLRGDTLTAGQGPMHIIRTAAMRRDLAVATGDADAAASWQGVVDRQIAVVANRDTLLGLLAIPTSDEATRAQNRYSR